jgi:hypothetical protein
MLDKKKLQEKQVRAQSFGISSSTSFAKKMPGGLQLGYLYRGVKKRRAARVDLVNIPCLTELQISDEQGGA